MTRRPTRRRALAGAATIGTALLSGVTAADGSAESDPASEPALQEGASSGNIEGTLEGVERAIEEYTSRPARGFWNENKGQARLTYLTDRTSTPALKQQIQRIADEYADIVESGAPAPSIYCLVEYGAIGETFRHTAEFNIQYGWAYDYTGGTEPSYDDASRQAYLERIYSTIERF